MSPHIVTPTPTHPHLLLTPPGVITAAAVGAGEPTVVVDGGVGAEPSCLVEGAAATAVCAAVTGYFSGGAVYC